MKLEFPCEFALKIMGKNTRAFEASVLAVFNEQVPDLSEGAIEWRHSKENNYLALTVTFMVASQKQLDTIYNALAEAEDVIMTL